MAKQCKEELAHLKSWSLLNGLTKILLTPNMQLPLLDHGSLVSADALILLLLETGLPHSFQCPVYGGACSAMTKEFINLQYANFEAVVQKNCPMVMFQKSTFCFVKHHMMRLSEVAAYATSLKKGVHHRLYNSLLVRKCRETSYSQKMDRVSDSKLFHGLHHQKIAIALTALRLTSVMNFMHSQSCSFKKTPADHSAQLQAGVVYSGRPGIWGEAIWSRWLLRCLAGPRRGWHSTCRT